MRAGVRLVVSDCADARREREFHDWYDAQADVVLRAGRLTRISRYRRQDDEQPRFAAIFDIDDAPESAWDETVTHPAMGDAPPLTPLLVVRVAATYRTLATAGSLDGAAEITLVLSDLAVGADPSTTTTELAARGEEAVASGDAAGAALFELIGETAMALPGEPPAPRLLELYPSGASKLATGAPRRQGLVTHLTGAFAPISRADRAAT
jgi:hypothetical protein